MAEKDKMSRSNRTTSKNIRATLVYAPSKIPVDPIAASPKNTQNKQKQPKAESPLSFTRAILNENVSPRNVLSCVATRTKPVQSSEALPLPRLTKTVSAELVLPPPIDELRQNFVHMKEERDQCSQDLINYLSKSLRKSVSSVAEIPVDSNSSSNVATPIIFQPLQTPPNHQPNPSTSADPSLPIDAPAEVSAGPTAQPSSPSNRDQLRAKQFMQDQQRRRLMATKKTSQQSNVNATERKRRLAELHKSTQKILHRNVQNKAKMMASADQRIASKTTVDIESVVSTQTVTEVPHERGNANHKKAPDRGLITFANQPAKATTKQQPPSTSRLTDTTNHINMPSTSAKRIGILRRSEASIASSRPVSLHTLPTAANAHGAVRSASPPPKTDVANSSVPESPPSLSIPNVNLRSTLVGANQSNSPRDRHTTDSSIASSSSKSKRSRTSSDSKRTSKSSVGNAPINVPYWLKPSPLQVYPYNFIMAVRKKLEMIAHPVVLPVAPTRKQREVGTSVNKGELRERSKHFQKKSNLATNLQKEHAKECHTEPSSSMSEKTPLSNLKSLSDALTNLSSVSLHVPELSASKQSAVVAAAAADSDGTSSISSAIFSQSSPEKKKPAPLSTANLQKLSLNTAHGTLNRHPFVNMRRGAEVHQTPNAVTSPFKSVAHSSTTADATELVDMLNSFNQSLSHAIAVNHQLNNVLLNAPQSSGQTSSRATRQQRVPETGNDEEYSSKFDSATTSGNNTNRESLLANESSVHASTLASESLVSSARDHSAIAASSNEKSAHTHTVATDPIRLAPTTQSSSVIIDLTQESPIFRRPSVIVRNSPPSSISSDIVPQFDSQPSGSSISNYNTFKHSSEPSNSVPKGIQPELEEPLNAQSISKSSPSNALQSAINTHRSSSSSIRTELSDPVTRAGAPDQIPSARSILSVSTARSERFSSQSHNNSLSIRSSSNKENVSSSLNTIAKPSNRNDTTKNTSSSSIQSLTIQDSTVEFKEHDGFVDYRNGNIASSDLVDLNQSIGSDIFAAFNQIDGLDLSIASGNETTTVSEANKSYATLGEFDQLLKAETQKTDDLTALVRMREKALVDRTKGQVAWLELQKRRYQEQGLTVELTTVKKKQRALLMRLERERADLARYAKRQQQPRPQTPTRSAPTSARMNRRLSLPSSRSTPQRTDGSVAPKTAMKALDMSAGVDMEHMLHQREQDLRQRRQHVEHLIRWHQRLDAEEQAVLDMERRLMAHTNTASHHQQTAQATLHRKQIANIEHSLEVLQSMSGRRSINDDDDRSATDRVKMSGSKLNRLWRRLTGEATLKFDTSRRYVLTKVDIERLYEEAMRVVLLQFADGGPRVLDQTMNSTVATLESGGGARNQMGDEFVVVPSLNLEFSFADEELSTINTDGEKSGSAAVGYYFSDAAPGSAGRSNSEAKSATVETSVSEEHYTSEGFATASESKEQTAEDSSRSTRLPIPEVLENRLLVPNETFISDISCPPFDITERSASALDVDTSAVTAEHSYRNAVVDDNKDQQSPTIAADCQLGSSSRLDNDADSVSSAATATRSLEMPQPIDGAIGVESGSASELVEHIEIDRSESSTVVEESLIVEESSEGSPSVHAEEISAEPTTGESVSEASHSIGPLNDGSKVIGSGVEMTVGAAQLVAPRDYVGPTMEKPASKMPDIISEAEVLRRQQMKIEQEIKQLELNAPFVYLREIPNKPPPPYVPPAHGSPMTAIFPSDQRILDLVCQRVQQLHTAHYASDYAPEPPTDTNVTNIYERIVLDLCAQCYAELPIHAARTPPNQPPDHYFKQPLAFYNPPNRLECIQQHIVKRVRKLLRNGGHPVAPNSPTGTALTTIMHHSASRLVSNKRKRDVVDEILVQEMLDDDAFWTNFDVERVEVLANVANDVLRMMVEEAIGDCMLAVERRQCVPRAGKRE